MMRLATLTLCLFAVSCGPQDEANLPAAPGTTASPDASAPAPAEVAPLPGTAAVSFCTTLDAVAAAQAQRSLPGAGRAAGWAVNGDNKLVCSEPGPDGVVGCELAPGGSAVISNDADIRGYRNDRASPLAIRIDQAGLGCTDLEIPPSPS
jgi:hypothetical protein